MPMLALPEENRPIGYWGILRKQYLKKHKSGMYSYLLLTGKLDRYLADLNEQAQEWYELIEAQMRIVDGRCCNFANSRKDLLDWLKLLKDEQIVDIRKIYKSGVTDSVLDSYRSYLKQ